MKEIPMRTPNKTVHTLACPGRKVVFLGILVLTAAVGLAAAPPARTAAPAVTLVKDGQPQLPLIAGSVAEPVRELQQRLKEISGANFKLANAARGATGLYVGLAADFPWVKVEEPARLGAEGFILKTDGTSVFLIANEASGVRHGVTTLLHRLGCRWFFPGKVWEVIPRQQTLQLACDERQVPSFPINRRIWYGFGAYPPCARDLEEWNRHNRMGGPVDVHLGHSWCGLNPAKEFAEHPEWFALVNGKRQTSKPCYSHPDVIQRAIQHALAAADQGAGMISMSPPDGLGYCECERCMATLKGAAPYKSHGTTFAKRPDGVVVNVTSETLFRCVNEVAAAVAKKHPKTLIGCMAYSAYSQPPSFPLHPNVFVQVTTAYRRTDLTLEEQLAGFAKQGCRAGIRDYFSVYQWDWDASPGKKKLAPDALQARLRLYHQNAVASINAESSNNWGPRGLSYYLAAQLMWDVNADVKALLQDFYVQAFGPAAAVMERYYVRWYGAGAGLDEAAKGETDDAKEKPVDGQLLKALFQDLDEAARLVKDHPAYLARVDHLRMYLHYLYLRQRTQQAGKSKDEKAILEAVKAETVFGGRLTYTNMIHSRPLLGKAFPRRFREFMRLLDKAPEAQSTRKGGWRQVGQPPTHEELERLWAEDKVALKIK
jgi:hypothetical protein